MDNVSGILIALSLIGLVLLVVVIIALFYKPPKNLLVKCKLSVNGDKKTLDFEVLNDGKKRLKLQEPLVKFTHATSKKMFQVKKEYLQAKFPKVLKIGESFAGSINIDHYEEVLRKNSFEPTHVKVIFLESAGLEFQSHSIDFE